MFSDEEVEPALDDVLPAVMSSQKHTEQYPVFDTQPNVIAEEGNRKKEVHWRPMKINLTKEQEVMLAFWYKNNPVLYNKGARNYKDATLKTTLLEEKARSLYPPITGSQLKTWLDSMRTRYTRLTVKKNGGGALKYTKRERWILFTFSFLKKHIVRQPGRSCIQHCQPEPVPSSSRHQRNVEEEEDRLAEVPLRPGTFERGRRDPKDEDYDILLQKLKEKTRGNTELMNQAIASLQPGLLREATMNNLTGYVMEKSKRIHNNFIDEFEEHILKVLHEYIQKSRTYTQEKAGVAKKKSRSLESKV